MTPDPRHAESDADLLACHALMREPRPHLADVETFVVRVRRQAAAGYRILAAWDGGAPAGLAGYRPRETLIRGRFRHVDDLVVAAPARRRGIGALLLDAVADETRAAGLSCLVLGTALDKAFGQRFYFCYGMLPAAPRFALPFAMPMGNSAR